MASARWIALGARLVASGATRGLSAAPAAYRASRLARPVVGAGSLRLLLRPPARAVCCSASPPQAESSPADAKLQALNQQFQEAFKAKQLPRALGLAHTVRELAFEAYGSKHTVFASALNNVALVHKEMGQVDKAVPLYEQAYQIYKHVYGDDHPSTMVTRSNLAVACRLARKYDRAQTLWVGLAESYNARLQDSRAANEAPEARALSGYVYATSNLAGLHLEQGNVDDAEWFAWRALSRVLEVAGENSLEAATCMNNLALVFMETQQHLKARPLLEKAREVRTALLGPDHPQVALVEANLQHLEAAEAAIARADAAAAKARPSAHDDDLLGGGAPAAAAVAPTRRP